MPDTPVRVQMSRKKGWRMPPNTVYVGRPTKWGNPFTRNAVINWHLGDYQDDRMKIWREEAVALFKAWALNVHGDDYFSGGPECYRVQRCALDFNELRGKNLGCWCKIGSHCHADVLLELANA